MYFTDPNGALVKTITRAEADALHPLDYFEIGECPCIYIDDYDEVELEWAGDDVAGDAPGFCHLVGSDVFRGKWPNDVCDDGYRPPSAGFLGAFRKAKDAAKR